MKSFTTFKDSGWNIAKTENLNDEKWYIHEEWDYPRLSPPFSGGDGSIEDPYQIQYIEELNLVRGFLDKHFILMRHLDFECDHSYISLENKYDFIKGDWLPIGDTANRFTGTFDGQGYTISNLYINRSYLHDVGLFGRAENTMISNLGLIDVSINGNDTVGGLVGYNSGNISYSYSTGDITSTGDQVGGLVGYNKGTIIDSYAIGTVTGNDFVGGLVGQSTPDSTILHCFSKGSVTGNNVVGGLVGNDLGIIVESYAAGMVTGNEYVGGLVGNKTGSISKSYAIGDITSTGDQVGGLVGHNTGSIIDSYAGGTVMGNDVVGGLVGHNTGFINYSYAAGTVTGHVNVGGLVGRTDTFGHVSHSFYDNETSGQTISAGGTGKPYSDMQSFTTFKDSGWNIAKTDNLTDETWYIHEEWDYPRLSPPFSGGDGSLEDPYQIQYIEELNLVRSFLDKHFILMSDVDFESNQSYMSPVNKNKFIIDDGWLPIGDTANKFTGMLTGNNKVISNVFIDRDSTNYSSLFGRTDKATISNLGLIDVDITGNEHVGGLVGYQGYSLIVNSYSTGNITGTYTIGGLVGTNHQGSISFSYSRGNINGTSYIGGLVGQSTTDSTILHCFSTAIVTGSDSVGGLVGNNTGSLFGSFSNGNVTGKDTIGGLVGYNSGVLSDSYATGKIIGKSDIGGLVGYNQGGSLLNSYAIGNVLGDNNIGGLVGRTDTSGNISYSFYDTETSGQSDTGKGIPESTSNLMDVSTFYNTGWQIAELVDWVDETWYIETGSYYPRLGKLPLPIADFSILYEKGLSFRFDGSHSYDLRHGFDHRDFSYRWDFYNDTQWNKEGDWDNAGRTTWEYSSSEENEQKTIILEVENVHGSTTTSRPLNVYNYDTIDIHSSIESNSRLSAFSVTRFN